MRTIIKKMLSLVGIDSRLLFQRLGRWSLMKAAKEQDLLDTLKQLRQVVPDISNQESSGEQGFNDYFEWNRRLLHAYQVQFMRKLLVLDGSTTQTDARVVDIGDSAGTHCLYFQWLYKGSGELKTLSVNLDPRAIEKIKARGLPALLKRAEEIGPDDLGGEVDVFTSFEMVEHLHNPSLFLRRLSKCPTGKRLFITVPFLRRSRVGLDHIRHKFTNDVYAEDVHVFELSPGDWTLLFLHAGWRVEEQGICYQYPRRLPLISSFLKTFWQTFDFEGFWGVVLVRDATYSARYLDWED